MMKTRKHPSASQCSLVKLFRVIPVLFRRDRASRLAMLDAIANANPRNALASFLAAYEAWCLGKHALARRHARRAVVLFPDLAALLVILLAESAYGPDRRQTYRDARRLLTAPPSPGSARRVANVGARLLLAAKGRTTGNVDKGDEVIEAWRNWARDYVRDYEASASAPVNPTEAGQAYTG